MRGRVIIGIGFAMILLFISAMDSVGIGYWLACIGLLIGIALCGIGVFIDNLDEGRKEHQTYWNKLRRKGRGDTSDID